MLTFYLTGCAMAIFGHIHATTFLYPGCLQIKGGYIEIRSQSVVAHFKNNIQDDVTFCS